MGMPKVMDLNTQTTPLVGLKNNAVPAIHPTTPLDTKTPPGDALVTNIPWAEKTKIVDQYRRK